uniref:Trifunctional purine biosynthetic protein adenosine-3 n=1 Tax=Caenorhabditis tropicalis TaxID=1561998 RepID=A0A1I7TIY0_9PELO
MNVLIIGSGGREHALAWKIEQSDKVKSVLVAPGNGASGRIGKISFLVSISKSRSDLNPNNLEEVSEFCEKHYIGCVLIGPEEPLSNGLADYLIENNPKLMVFGPTKEGAQLETSKSFSKKFMKEYGLPTADFVTVSIDDVKSLDSVFERVPWKHSVVKADGLAAGKGVLIPKDNQEAIEATRSILQGEFGNAGRTVVIEERLEGYEVSALAFVDGISYKRMPLGRDHKRLLENDMGPNTGGMGVVAPVKVPETVDKQIDEIFEKTLKGLAERNIKYCGVLYAGLMIVQEKPHLLEFNCRFGDPETQIGGFGAVLDLKSAGFSNESQLVVGIDGVGTKIEVATQCNNFNGIGYDVVAMCVNDVICHCAKPIAFLDYYVCGKLDRSMAKEVLSSISNACAEAGCSLIGKKKPVDYGNYSFHLGGETAEMPGVYGTHQWDLAGCAIAARESTWPMLPLSSSIIEGDVIIGLPSSGLHSNGFSLARKVLTVNGVKYSDPLPWNQETSFGDELLKGTKLYVKTVLPLLTSGLVKGCAHITGGGLTENAIRVLEKRSDVSLVIDCSKWKPQEIFNWIASAGPVETKEMIRTFNCGIGMVLVVRKEKSEEVKRKLSNEEFFEIGSVEKKSSNERIRFINENSLFQPGAYRKERKRVKVAILISGTGTNMQKLIEKSKTPESNCEVVVVISNKETAGGLKLAASYGVPTRVVPHTADRITGDTELAKVLKEFGTELVCLGGYMRILSAYFISQFPSRIINIHPSLLPSFKGSHALQDALDFGAKVVGCTAHFVDELVDHGDIIAQRPVIVEDGDTIETLRQKIQVQEHEMFPNAMISVAAKLLEK